MTLYLALGREMSGSGIHEGDGRGAVFAFFIVLSLCLYFVLYVR